MAEESVTSLPDNPWEKAGISEEEGKTIMAAVEGYYNQLDAFVAKDIFENDTKEDVNRRALCGALALLLCKAGLYTGYTKEHLIELVGKSFDLSLTAIINERLEKIKEEPHGDAL